MIDNIIFDFGNVLAKFDLKYILSHFIQDEEDKKIFMSAIYENWKLLDSGDMDYEDYIKTTKEKLPSYLHDIADEMFYSWHKYMPYTDGIQSLLKNLKQKGYRLFILSNASVYFGEILDYFEITKLFEDKIISGNIKMVKPSKEIYLYAIDKFGIDAQNTLFIDDKYENVEGAKACDINSVLFENDVKKLKTIMKEQFYIDI